MPMLMPQLQRPLTRSLAAAWRPAHSRTLAASSTRRHFSAAQAARPSTEQRGDAPAAKPSLFAELFPDEARQRDRSPNSSSRTEPRHGSDTAAQAHSSLVKPPPRTLSPLPQSAHPLISYYEDSSHHPASASAQQCIVVLNAVSKYLTESDFYRVGAGRAAHVEGWVAGITKVTQARDPDTLEPLGRYYISFETAAAAAAWREEVKRLWRISREHTPGVIRRRATKGTADFEVLTPSAATPRATSGRTRRDGGLAEMEMVRREVEGFTLVSPGLPWDLETAKYTAEERAMEHAGSLVEKLCRKAGTKFLVMVAVGGGRISSETLRTVIREDGLQRGLAWRVKNLEAKVDNEAWGIKPFGKSGLKAQDRMSTEESLAEHGDGAVGGEQQKDRGVFVDKARDEARMYPRFLVPFLDEAEARRFVRNWHRRELTLKMGHQDADAENKEWEESRTLNVTILW